MCTWYADRISLGGTELFDTSIGHMSIEFLLSSAFSQPFPPDPGVPPATSRAHTHEQYARQPGAAGSK